MAKLDLGRFSLFSHHFRHNIFKAWLITLYQILTACMAILYLILLTENVVNQCILNTSFLPKQKLKYTILERCSCSLNIPNKEHAHFVFFIKQRGPLAKFQKIKYKFHYFGSYSEMWMHPLFVWLLTLEGSGRSTLPSASCSPSASASSLESSDVLRRFISCVNIIQVNPFKRRPKNIYSQEEINLYFIIKLATQI